MHLLSPIYKRASIGGALEGGEEEGGGLDHRIGPEWAAIDREDGRTTTTIGVNSNLYASTSY